MAAQEIVVDAYSALSHKEVVGAATNRATAAVAPGVVDVASGWCPVDERRRLSAYAVRDAYRRNVARLVLPHDVTDLDRAQHREYGDADLIVDRYRAGVLGEGWTLSVDGANDDLDDEPQLPDFPGEAPQGANDVELRVHAARLERWEAEANALVDEWVDAWAAQPALRERQDEIREWSDRVGLGPLIVESEGDTLALGDSVMVLWPQAGDWPRPQVMDPAGYFPVLDEHDDGDFPEKIHFAWEFDRRDADGTVTRMVRRITFELVDLHGSRVEVLPDGSTSWVGNPGLVDGEAIVEGRITRTVPWSDEPTTVTCLLSDGTWPTDAVGDDIDALGDDKAEWRTLADGTVLRRHDLRVDFIPAVHIPSGPTGKEHFGSGVLDNVAQGLDDLAGVDSLTMSAAQYLGHPTIYSAGASGGDGVTTPGVVIGGPEGGRMDVLDLSSGVEKLQALDDAILDRVLANARLPKAMVGRADYTQASGVRVAMEFAPFDQTVAIMRMCRDQKWRLLLRFAQRLAQVSGALEPGPTPVARLVPGPYRPANVPEVVTMVAAALQAHAISTQTAVAVLVANGLPIADARGEVDRIRAEDTESAKALADATGSEALAAERMGLDLPESTDPAPTPVVQLPPVPPVSEG